MFILIVGGGKVGSYLTRALLNQGHEVVVVEKDERKAKALERLDRSPGDDRRRRLRSVGARSRGRRARRRRRCRYRRRRRQPRRRACSRKKKSKARCIARVNNPANKLIFDSLDLEDPVTVISSTEIILDVLNEHVNAAKYRCDARNDASLRQGEHAAGEGRDSRRTRRSDNKRLAEINLPHNSVVVAIDRPDKDLEIPTGDTMTARRRSMIVIVKNGAAERIRTLIGG